MSEAGGKHYKTPLSVLVVIHTPDLRVLLLERAHHPGYWQSVTGSHEADDADLAATALREVQEETGIRAQGFKLLDWQHSTTWEIFEEWRHRYAPGVTHNTEHTFSLEVPLPYPVNLAPDEHRSHRWLPWVEAAKQVFSWSNRDAILELPQRTGGPRPF